MNANEWLNKLPNLPGTTRNKMILDAVAGGLAHCGWEQVKSSADGNEAIFFVTDDAFRVALEDGSRYRFPVSARLAQQCADAIHCSLVTPKILDLSYQQATVKLGATLLPAKPDMVTITKSKQFNQELERKRAGRTGLIRDCGKAWVISNRLGKNLTVGINHGFYDPKAPYVSPGSGLKLWQNRGAAHDYTHTDYSQTLILMSSQCLLNGESVPVKELMTHPKLWKLISDEGVLKYTRQHT